MLDQSSNKAADVETGRRPLSIALGFERFGLVAMKTPILSMIVLAICCVGAAFGLDRIKVDDSLSQLFRSNSPEFKQYEEVTRKFPSNEYDVLVVIEGKTLMQREVLMKVRDLVTDLQLIDGVRGLISLFSARQAPAPGKFPAPLFPSDLPTGAAYDQFVETVKANEIIRGKLLVGGRHAGAGRACARSVDRPDQGLERHGRRNPQDPGSGYRWHRPHWTALGRARHAARNPQCGRARRHHLQRRRRARRLPDRDPVLPPCLVHDHRGVPAADRDPARAR